jgi:hypothetical protein
MSKLQLALMMEAERTSETSANFYHTIRRNIPEDGHFHTRRRQKLKFHPYTNSFRLMLQVQLEVTG